MIINHEGENLHKISIAVNSNQDKRRSDLLYIPLLINPNQSLGNFPKEVRHLMSVNLNGAWLWLVNNLSKDSLPLKINGKSSLPAQRSNCYLLFSIIDPTNHC